MKRLSLIVSLFAISLVALCQTTFRPVKATMTDSQGSFSSTTFDCSNMVLALFH